MNSVQRKVLPGNAQDQGDREYQEDAFGFTKQTNPDFVRHAGVAAVLCDGMGGLEFGADAARLGVDTFLAEYGRKTPDETVQQALRRAVERANDSVYKFAVTNNVVQRTGCTLVAAVVRGVELHCIHAGDSRAYLFTNGRLERLTLDHDYARLLDVQVAQGEISQADALAHPRREHVTSNLGRAELSLVDVLDPPRRLKPQDYVLLCSDGLHGILRDDEIALEMRGRSQDAAKQLVQRVLASPVQDKDNVTVLLMQIQADGSLQYSHRQSREVGLAPTPRTTPMLADGYARDMPKPNTVQQRNDRFWWAMSAIPLVAAAGIWVGSAMNSPVSVSEELPSSGSSVEIKVTKPTTSISNPMNSLPTPVQMDYGSSTIVQSIPVVPIRQIAAPGINTPVAPGNNTPVAPGKNTPPAPGINTPVAPGNNTPVAPGNSTPVAAPTSDATNQK